jgi:hypothetical protein
MDFIALLGIVMLVVCGGFLFLGVPITIFLLKDRLSFWPRAKWQIMVYEAEIKEFKVGEKPLLDAQGNPTLDTKGNPVTNDVFSKRVVITSEKPELTSLCWCIKQKIIEWVWVDRGMLKGFKLDKSFLAHMATTDTGKKVLRVAHISKGVWDGGSFYPLDDVDITMVDARHAIFSHKIDKETVDQSISGMTQTAWSDFQKNRARKDEDAIMQLIQMAAPAFIVLVCLIAVVFTYDFASKSSDKSMALTDKYMAECSAGYTLLHAQPTNTTTTQPAPTTPTLPFG